MYTNPVRHVTMATRSPTMAPVFVRVLSNEFISCHFFDDWNFKVTHTFPKNLRMCVLTHSLFILRILRHPEIPTLGQICARIGPEPNGKPFQLK